MMRSQRRFHSPITLPHEIAYSIAKNVPYHSVSTVSTIQMKLPKRVQGVLDVSFGSIQNFLKEYPAGFQLSHDGTKVRRRVDANGNFLPSPGDLKRFLELYVPKQGWARLDCFSYLYYNRPPCEVLTTIQSDDTLAEHYTVQWNPTKVAFLLRKDFEAIARDVFNIGDTECVMLTKRLASALLLLAPNYFVQLETLVKKLAPEMKALWEKTPVRKLYVFLCKDCRIGFMPVHQVIYIKRIPSCSSTELPPADGEHLGLSREFIVLLACGLPAHFVPVSFACKTFLFPSCKTWLHTAPFRLPTIAFLYPKAFEMNMEDSKHPRIRSRIREKHPEICPPCSFAPYTTLIQTEFQQRFNSNENKIAREYANQACATPDFTEFRDLEEARDKEVSMSVEEFDCWNQNLMEQVFLKLPEQGMCVPLKGLLEAVLENISDEQRAAYHHVTKGLNAVCVLLQSGSRNFPTVSLSRKTCVMCKKKVLLKKSILYVEPPRTTMRARALR